MRWDLDRLKGIQQFDDYLLIELDDGFGGPYIVIARVLTQSHRRLRN